ncbi:MAG: methionyl-tRNA formyltransferase [Bacteroidota bacterium]
MNRSLSDLRIVFMGTPAFAVASLEALLHAGANIVGVITAPDKPAGRGLQLQHFEVKKAALRHQLPLLQPEKLKDPDFQEQLRSWQADVQVVVAFRMLPESVWNMPSFGSINLHASLLPNYRGAAPINWAIIRGETQTGVTTFRLKHEIDTGGILLQETVPIDPAMNAGELHDRLMLVGARLVVQTLEGISAGTLTEHPQMEVSAENPLPTAPKIHTETCRIDWNQPAERVYDLIRGLSPYPGAFAEWNQTTIKIFRAELELCKHDQAPGTWQSDNKSRFSFAASDGWIHVQELQIPGKKRMDVASWLRGYRLPTQ